MVFYFLGLDEKKKKEHMPLVGQDLNLNFKFCLHATTDHSRVHRNTVHSRVI